MQFNCKMGYSGNEQDYQLIKTSLSELKKSNNQKEVLRYLTNVLPNPTDIVSLDNAQNTVKSVKAQLANKNLIPYPYYNTSKTESGITWTVNTDGSITVNGTSTATSNFYLKQTGTFVLPAGTYTVNIGINSKDIYIVSGGTPINGNRTFTLDAAGTIGYLVVQIPKNKTLDNITIYPQLELGTTATAYTPYVPDLTAVKVSRCGKNLFDNNKLSEWGLTLTDNKYTGSVDGLSEKTLFSNFAENKRYTVSLKGYNNTAGITTLLLMVYYKDGTNVTAIRLSSNEEKTYSFTTEADKSVDYMKFSYYQGDTITLSYIQIEEGTIATDYEPYIGAEYTPSSDGTVNGITVLTPTTNIINDKGLLFTKVIGDDFNYIN